MERKTSLGSLGVGYDSKGNKLTQSSVVARHALKIIGALQLHTRDTSFSSRARLG